MKGQITKVNKYILWLFIAVSFTSILIIQSLRQGQLSLPPTYDDIVYFNDAAARLGILYDRGFNALLLNIIQNPPHSPLATTTAFIGFLIFGINNWAPPAINGIFVFFLLIFLDKLSTSISLFGRLIIAIIALTWPVTGQLVIQCRPDLVWGLSTACFTVISLRQQANFTTKKETQLIIGLLIGFSLLAKPAIFPITLAAALSSLFIASVTDLYLFSLWGKKRLIIFANLRCLGIAFLIAFPYYILAYKQVYAYIYDVVFSSNASMWDPNSNLSLSDNLLYYLTAASGQMMMGNWFYVWLFLIFFCLITILFKRDWNKLSHSLPLIGGFIILYALVTLPKLKMNFFGASLYFYILITSAQMIIYLIKILNFKVGGFNYKFGYLASLIFLLFGLNQFVWTRSPVLSSEVQYREEMINSLYKDIVQNRKSNKIENTEPIKVFFTATNSYFNAHTLDFYFKKNNVKNATSDLYLSGALSLYAKSFETSDYIVAFSPDNTDLINWIPSYKIQKKVLEMLNADKNLKLMKVYSSPYNGNNQAFLYAKKSYLSPKGEAFENFSNPFMLTSLEGPYPSMGLPSKYRWGLGPATHFQINIPSSGKAKLIIDGRPAKPNQILTVKLDNTIVYEHKFGNKNIFEMFEVPIAAKSGSHLVELSYKNWLAPSETEPRSLAILFRSLRIVPITHQTLKKK